MNRGDLNLWRLFTLVCILSLLSACLPVKIGLSTTPEAQMTETPTPLPDSLWLEASIPEELRQGALTWGIPLVEDASTAALQLSIAPMPMLDGLTATWIYALVAPFPTVVDGISTTELRQAWGGVGAGVFTGRPLLMDESTLAAFSVLWGTPASGAVRTMPADQLLDAAWAEQPSWAIIPFESLEPRWKVLAIDDKSPVRKEFDPSGYPLTAVFSLQCASPCSLSPLPSIPATNRDPSKLTTLVMTGVTALVRATAYTMEAKGVLYPGRDIRDWLRSADIAHISNEIPFWVDCPYPNPNQSKLIFCSSPRYIELLEDVGTDVVELTGNHFGDYGTTATLNTLQMYRDRGWLYFGGGENLEDARKPITLEHNGNKLAFIGCNPDGPGYAWATEDRPGAAPCDFEYITAQIKQLRSQGYLPIATFQYYESYSLDPGPQEQWDFRSMADAGALVVSGEQAHIPRAMEFYNGAFIHYGLGNLFFDQMFKPTKACRREFLDRHVFYDGRYISTELLTAMLQDYSRPQPMTPEQRIKLLADIFDASGWGPAVEIPTPTPTATLTLTPMTPPQPVYTLTPVGAP